MVWNACTVWTAYNSVMENPSYVGSLGYASRENGEEEGGTEILGLTKYKGAKVKNKGARAGLSWQPRR